MTLTPNTHLQWLANVYCERNHFQNNPARGHYVQLDHTLAYDICQEYEKLPVLANDHLTRKCYADLVAEVWAQFDLLLEYGYDFQPWQQAGQPYANSAEMCADVRDNKHIYFFTGGEPNPYMSQFAVKLYGVDCTINDIFRGVHDVFGHACEGYGFGQRGEENAWIHHSMMFRAFAQAALTTETRGQNSWVNENLTNRHLPACNKPFAVQKAALMPAWCSRLPELA